MSAPRIGAIGYPNREWEVWNDSYSRDEWEVWNDSYRDRTPTKTPWAIFHPVIATATGDFATHAEAIAYITAGDWDA